MAEPELEEGEAGCYYKDHVDVDDKTTFDKDLSYIVRILFCLVVFDCQFVGMCHLFCHLSV